MIRDALITKIRNDEPVIGLGNMYPAAGIIEGMCKGWDWVFVDGQHGQMPYDAILQACWAAKSIGVGPIVRVPGHAHEFLGPYADLAPSGIIVPVVDTPEQARHIVNGLRFPPLGTRSYGGRRVIDLHGRDYYREQDMLVILQIETLQAVENADAIAAIEGVDGIFIGPDDMKLRLGLDINTPIDGAPELANVFETVGKAAQKHGKFAGSGTSGPDHMAKLIPLGYRLFLCGADIMFLRNGAADKLQTLRQGMPTPKANPGSQY